MRGDIGRIGTALPQGVWFGLDPTLLTMGERARCKIICYLERDSYTLREKVYKLRIGAIECECRDLRGRIGKSRIYRKKWEQNK